MFVVLFVRHAQCKAVQCEAVLCCAVLCCIRHPLSVLQLLEQLGPPPGFFVEDVGELRDEDARASDGPEGLDGVVESLSPDDDAGGEEVLRPDGARVDGGDRGSLQAAQALVQHQLGNLTLGLSPDVRRDQKVIRGLEVRLDPLQHLLDDLQQARALLQRPLRSHHHALALDDPAPDNLLQVVLPHRGARAHQVQDDVRAAHVRRGLQRAVRCQQQHRVRHAVLREEVPRRVLVPRHHLQRVLLGPPHLLQVLDSVDIRKVALGGHAEREVAAAVLERVVDDDQVVVAVGELVEHVVAEEAEVDVAVLQPPHDVARALEPDLELGDGGHLRHVLPRVGLADGELAGLEQAEGVLGHAAL
mmetsp:Transcript_1564/g.3531  ORF Transcript_1564/g.3531 Transcript_1564/m.3531 type:complete len:359 (-) Transcript_1564:421-1497(-)